METTTQQISIAADNVRSDAAGKAAGDETKRELLEALEGFGKDFDGSFCFCLLRVGHPGVSDHSKACKKARAAIAKAKKMPI